MLVVVVVVVVVAVVAVVDVEVVAVRTTDAHTEGEREKCAHGYTEGE